MKLKVGSKYRTRDGNVATITKNTQQRYFPFWGRIEGEDFERCWNELGYWAATSGESQHDLIEEIYD